MTVYSIFDYFKEAFHLNRSNKSLYKPQIALIIIKSLMILITGIIVFGLSSRIESGTTFEQFVDHNELGVLLLGAAFLGFMFLYLIISRIIEAGLFNMFKSAVVDGEVKQGDFWIGVRKYFFKFLGGDVLIVLAWILAAIPYVIAGVVTVTVGFALIPLIVDIFLTMWRVSLVMNDSGVIDAFKDSYRFAKRNFYALALLQIINWSFTRPAPGGSGGNISNLSDLSNLGKDNGTRNNQPNPFENNPYDGGGNSYPFQNQSFHEGNSVPSSNDILNNPLKSYNDVVNPFDKGGSSDALNGNISDMFNNNNPFGNGNLPMPDGTHPFSRMPNQDELTDSAVKALKIGIGILVPVITIAAAVGALIKMIFEIFFSLALFVAYKNEVREENEPKQEVFF